MHWDRENELVNIWRDDTNNEPMELTTLAQLVKNGFTTCAGDCISRQLYQDGCSCIRSLFPTPTHYKLYQELRTQYTEQKMKDAVLAQCMEIHDEKRRHTL